MKKFQQIQHDCLSQLKDRLSGLQCLSAFGRLRGPAIFQNINLKYFKFKNKINYLYFS